MQNAASLSRKDTLVAFRVAVEDVEYFKKSAEADYKRGEIKAPTLPALAKHLMYRHLRMLKDIEKARVWKGRQTRNPHDISSEVATNVNNDHMDDNYDDDGLTIKRPFFYELPEWKERIAKERSEHSTA